jgi:hypothetical protein
VEALTALRFEQLNQIAASENVVVTAGHGNRGQKATWANVIAGHRTAAAAAEGVGGRRNLGEVLELACRLAISYQIADRKLARANSKAGEIEHTCRLASD